MRSTQEVRDAWAPPCSLRSAGYRFWSGPAVTVDARVIPALRLLDGILEKFRYAPRSGVTGAYNCRKITGGSGYSLHAYGIAVDINWDTNPYGARLVTDMPRAMVDAICAIRTVDGLPVWRWGGYYAGHKDAMHYEVVASPAELARGLVGAAPAPVSDKEVEMFQIDANHPWDIAELPGDQAYVLTTDRGGATVRVARKVKADGHWDITTLTVGVGFPLRIAADPSKYLQTSIELASKEPGTPPHAVSGRIER